MANLDRLMKIKGVWAAGEFTEDGKLVAYKGNISEEQAAMAAEMCAANNAMAKMQCDGYTAFFWSRVDTTAWMGSYWSQVLCVCYG